MTKMCFSLFVLLTLSAFIGNKAVNGGKPATCRPEFEAMTPMSTMCMVDSPLVLRTGVSEAEKQFILKFHNDRRAITNPVATDLFKLVWDDKIAEVAQKYTQQCLDPIDHDKNRNVPSYPGVAVGQNMALNYPSWETAMAAWYNEKDLFKYGVPLIDYLGPHGFSDIGHYTQFVASGAYRIGCGFAKCSNGIQYICNYGHGQSNSTRPYRNGYKEKNRCSVCPNNCKDGLCDCGGLMCLNWGEFDKNTCQCHCPAIWGGSDCSILQCPEKEQSHCPYWTADDCQAGVNVPIDCPYMCGVCKHKCGAKTCQNGGTLNLKTCQCECKEPYGGSECETHKCGAKTCQNGGTLNLKTCQCECKEPYGGSECETLKNCPDKDEWYCNTQWDSTYCTDYSNVKTECPFMCGVCKDKCGAKTCQNGGTLNSKTCQCECKEPYGGSECEIKNCPDKDEWYCEEQWDSTYCGKYSNVPTDCPYMCGICKK